MTVADGGFLLSQSMEKSEGRRLFLIHHSDHTFGTRVFQVKRSQGDRS